MHIKRLIFRIFAKFFEHFLRYRTRFLRPVFRTDPSTLLLETKEESVLERENAIGKLVSAMRSSLHSATPSAIRSDAKAQTVHVIIPFRDAADLTDVCLTSLLAQSYGGLVQVLLVDNGSTEPKTRYFLTEVQSRISNRGWLAKIIRVDEAFNFSRLNNLAVEAAVPGEDDFLLLLNNDVQLIENTSLERLLHFAQVLEHSNEKLGIIGATLIYPSGKIQHLFVAPGVKIVGAHPLKGYDFSCSESWRKAPRAVPATTGALMFMRAQLYQQLSGFDESLPTAYQDVDLCLKVQRTGAQNWVLSDLVAVHHESATREKTLSVHEVERMYLKWGKTLSANSGHAATLSRWSEDPLLTIGEGPYPWKIFAQN